MASQAARLVGELHAGEDFAAGLRQRAAARPGRIALPGAEDPRVVAAAIALRELGMARPLLIGETAVIRQGLLAEGADAGAFEICDGAQDPRRRQVAELLLSRRRDKGMDEREAEALASAPLHFAAGLLGLGVVDAVVAGATHRTADVIRAGLQMVGCKPGIECVSGAFLMLPGASSPLRRPLLFADAGVIPTPTENQLVAIGRAAAYCFEFLCQSAPRIACLSFSTHGSAEHESAQQMRKVAQRLQDGGLCADGELQVDAALDSDIAARKAPRSPVQGSADVLIFPDLNAANIGYKIAQRLGGWSALGPLLLGFAKPLHDLSRGCSARDVVDVSAIALLEAAL